MVNMITRNLVSNRLRILKTEPSEQHFSELLNRSLISMLILQFIPKRLSVLMLVVEKCLPREIVILR